MEPGPGRSGREGAADIAVERIRPAYQQVASQLRRQIIAGGLKAGDRLPNEAELCTMFGVSRSTVREALRILTAQNMVRISRGVNGGVFVEDTDVDSVSAALETSLGMLTGNASVSVANMLEARELVEIPAARFAAARRTPEQLEAMAEVIAAERGTLGQGRRFGKHHSFHALLADATGNPLLRIMSESVFRVLQNKYLRDDVTNDFWTEVDYSHTAIFEAVRDGDADRAAAAMSVHLDELNRLYSDSPTPSEESVTLNGKEERAHA